MWSSDSDCCESKVSDGEPYLTLKEEVRRGDYAAVKAALEAGSNVNDRDDDSYTLLHWAAGVTDPDNLDEVNARPSNNMHSRRKIVRLLLDQGAVVWRIWWQQEFFGDLNGQRAWDLTTHKATIVSLKKACVNQVIDMIRRNLPDQPTEAKCSGLVAAASLDMVDEMMEIYRAGTDANSDACGVTALSEAAAEGCLDTIQALIEQCNAKVDHDIDQYGTTALWIACANGKQDVVTYLLGQNANPFIEKDGPITIWIDDSNVLGIVLSDMDKKIQQLDSEVTDWLAKLAYHIFITSGYLNGIFTLLNAGKVPPPNSLQTAVAFGQVETLELLLAEGAMKSYDGKKESRWYGNGENMPPKNVVVDCQAILDSTLLAAEEFRGLQE